MKLKTISLIGLAAVSFPLSAAVGQQSISSPTSVLSVSDASSSGDVPIVSAAQARQPKINYSSFQDPAKPATSTPKVTPQVQPQAISGSSYQILDEPQEDSDNGFKLGGWVQAGYSSQSTGLFNNSPDKLNANQVWLYAEKKVGGNGFFDFGYRVDAMYGTDAKFTQAFGNPPGTYDFQNGLDHGNYGFAFPQAYLEFGNDDTSLKVGHFYTSIGYETVTSPDNFFYSHAITMFNTEPFTHTGFVASHQVDDDTSYHAGWTFGWDTGFAQSNGGSSFLGGFSKQLCEDIKLTYTTTIGDFGWRGSGYSHSVVVETKLTDRLDYIVQSDLLNTDRTGNNNSEVGLNQYLIYKVNDKLSAGSRMEWWKSDNTGSSRSTYAATGGITYQARENLMFRQETRYNWGADIVAGADMRTPIFAVDMIITF